MIALAPFQRIALRLGITLAVLTLSLGLRAQDRFATIDSTLRLLSRTMPGLEKPVDLSVSGAQVKEFIRALAETNQLNISVDPSIQKTMVNNFSGVSARNVLVFLCRAHDLDLRVTGNIIQISPFAALAKEYTPSPLRIQWDTAVGGLLSVDFHRDSLSRITREITELTGINVLHSSKLKDLTITCFIQRMPLGACLTQMADMAGIALRRTSEGIFILEPMPELVNQIPSQGKKATRSPTTAGQTENEVVIRLDAEGLLTVTGEDVPLEKMLREAASLSGISIVGSGPGSARSSVDLRGVTFDQLLTAVLSGTDLWYVRSGGAYLLVPRNSPQLYSSRVIRMKHRSVEGLKEIVPATLTKGLEVIYAPEISAVVASGMPSDLDNLEGFLHMVDFSVPLVLIDVVIVDQSRTHTVTTGIQAGLGSAPMKTTGQIFPAPNVNLSTEAINALINTFNSFGWLILDNVTPDFYLTLNAMEVYGMLKVRSTPRLSTLNGHEATLSIGETEYYVEERNDVIGTQNPQNITTRTFKSVNADLSVTLLPIVSADSQITLQITVEQSDFTERISEDAPPGQVSRSFTSTVRVSNGQAVLLGGLEEKSSEQSGSGLPWLSRVPILKWFVSSRRRDDNTSKLSIFIMPTIVY